MKTGRAVPVQQDDWRAAARPRGAERVDASRRGLHESAAKTEQLKRNVSGALEMRQQSFDLRIEVYPIRPNQLNVVRIRTGERSRTVTL
jgi:hypothetical protein